jgi:hypothetical protein
MRKEQTRLKLLYDTVSGRDRMPGRGGWERLFLVLVWILPWLCYLGNFYDYAKAEPLRDVF